MTVLNLVYGGYGEWLTALNALQPQEVRSLKMFRSECSFRQAGGGRQMMVGA